MKYILHTGGRLHTGCQTAIRSSLSRNGRTGGRDAEFTLPFFLARSLSLVFLDLQFVSRHLVLHGRLSCADAGKRWPDEGAVFSFMLCDRPLLPSAVPTRCAARLLFMSACKATSAEANGITAVAVVGRMEGVGVRGGWVGGRMGGRGLFALL